MTPQLAFGLGVVLGAVLVIFLAVALAYRDGHPFGDTPREEEAT
jgi:hypothetical protein